jgi:hypothetical protein
MQIRVKKDRTIIRLDKREREAIRNAVMLLASLSQHDVANQLKLESAINAIEDAMETYNDPVEVPAV